MGQGLAWNTCNLDPISQRVTGQSIHHVQSRHVGVGVREHELELSLVCALRLSTKPPPDPPDP